MKFTELEKLMSSRGVNSLADIARALDTTPQAVSNWKARDQIPYHIIDKMNKIISSFDHQTYTQSPLPQLPIHDLQINTEEKTISSFDILVTIAEQLKIILLVPFITIFLTFTYVKFIQQPLYISTATIILPDTNPSNLGGFASIASQFGMNIPTGVQADLSSPSLFPELIRSRTFAETILDKKFFSKKYNEELTLLALLTHGNKPPSFGHNTLIYKAHSALGEILSFEQDPRGINSTSVIKVTAPEPLFAKELADVVLVELRALNRFFKSQTVSEKTSFIENRIASVQSELIVSEKRFKAFNEQNRQISSPALELEEDRLVRDVEVQRSVYLTLKQQLELAKIEEIQGGSVIQVLDKPQVPLAPSNIKLFLNVILAGLFGIVLGLFLAFLRSYTHNSDKTERKKLRRFKSYFLKKGKDFLIDRRATGLVSIMLLVSLPYYLGYRSQNPVFFGIYSTKIMILNTVYILCLLFSILSFFYFGRKKY